MSFDPLHKWLGIPPSEQPPNYYRLLGIPLFEIDGDVIDAAADKQLDFLHKMANGVHAEAAEKLSNRVSAARICLLRPEKKAAYDDQLRRSGQAAGTPATSIPSGVAVSARSALHGREAIADGSATLQAAGWFLHHGDGMEQGPFPFENLIDAARRGHIVDSTVVRHPVVTGDQWLPALSLPKLASVCPQTPRSVAASPSRVTSEIKIRTRRRLGRHNRSYLFSVASSLAPPLILFFVFAAIYRDPRLRTALDNALRSSQSMLKVEQASEIIQVPKQVVPTRPEPPIDLESTSSDVGEDRTETQAAKMSSLQASLEEPSLSPELSSNESLEVEATWHHLALDLSSPRWSGSLDGADRNDEFMIFKVENSPSGTTIEPPSRMLSFGETTTLHFSDIEGLQLQLKLITIGESDEVTMSGRFLVDGQRDFRRDTLIKQWNAVAKSLAVSAKNIASLHLAAKQAQDFLDSAGPKTLMAVQQAERQLNSANAALGPAVEFKGKLERQWNHLKQLVDKIEQLNEKGELVIRSVRSLGEEEIHVTASQP